MSKSIADTQSVLFLMNIGVFLVPQRTGDILACITSFTCPYYSFFTQRVQHFFLDQVGGVCLALRCQITPLLKCSMWSYSFIHAIGLDGCKKQCASVSQCVPFLQKDRTRSTSKQQVACYKLHLEFFKKTKRFSLDKRLKVGCHKTPQIWETQIPQNGSDRKGDTPKY